MKKLISFILIASIAFTAFADVRSRLINKADKIKTTTTNFGGELSSADNTVQKALDTLDDITLISDHGGLAGLTDDDHTQYLLANGTRTVSASDAQLGYAQSSATGTEDQPLIFINDDRTGTTANEVGEATVVIDAEGAYSAYFLDGKVWINDGWECANQNAWVGTNAALVIKDDHYLKWGTGQDILSEYDEGDDNWQIWSNAGATTNTDIAFYTFGIDADNDGLTANQELFEVGTGGGNDADANFVEKFSVDAEGDVVCAGTLTPTGAFLDSHIFSMTIYDPDNIQGTVDAVTVMCIEAEVYPNGITFTDLGIKTNASSSYTVVFEEWSDPTTHANDLESVATSASTEAEDDGTIGNGSGGNPGDCDAGSILKIDLPATDIDELTVWGVFVENAS